VAVLPVADVDRAKAFYEGLGWRLDADLTVNDGYRVIQSTPPGSPASDYLRPGPDDDGTRLGSGPDARHRRHRCCP
jgi:catechol 2,3-dioxygenase-like lactoylglutathione lyase family enzyme